MAKRPHAMCRTKRQLSCLFKRRSRRHIYSIFDAMAFWVMQSHTHTRTIYDLINREHFIFQIHSSRSPRCTRNRFRECRAPAHQQKDLIRLSLPLFLSFPYAPACTVTLHNNLVQPLYVIIIGVGGGGSTGSGASLRHRVVKFWMKNRTKPKTTNAFHRRNYISFELVFGRAHIFGMLAPDIESALFIAISKRSIRTMAADVCGHDCGRIS